MTKQIFRGKWPARRVGEQREIDDKIAYIRRCLEELEASVDYLGKRDPDSGSTVAITSSSFANRLLDGSAHLDTVYNEPVRGSLIYGDSTPAWNSKANTTTAGTPLVSDGTDFGWTNSPTWTGLHTWTRGSDATAILINSFSNSGTNALFRVLDTSAVNIFNVAPSGTTTAGSTTSALDVVWLQARAPSTQTANIAQVVRAFAGGNYTAWSVGGGGGNIFGDTGANGAGVVRMQINQGSGQSVDMFRVRNTAASIDLVKVNSAGVFSLSGTTSGTISFGLQEAAGTYNWNLPTSAGSSGQPLLSGGGGSTAMSFGTLGVAGGGTGATTLTANGVLYGNGTSAIAATAAGTTGQAFIVTTGNPPQWSTDATWAGNHTFNQRIIFPQTTSDSIGLMWQEGAQLLHTFRPPTVNPGGDTNVNLFIGYGAGNFTLEDSTEEGFEGGDNVGVGYLALSGLTTGWINTGIGSQALVNVSSGIQNTAVGGYALKSLITGDYNFGMGINCLNGIITGSRNTGLGASAGVNCGDVSDLILIGAYCGAKCDVASTFMVDAPGAPRDNHALERTTAIIHGIMDASTPVNQTLRLNAAVTISESINVVCFLDPNNARDVVVDEDDEVVLYAA